MTSTGTAAVDAVVFDIGAVLIEWSPRYLYRRIFTLPDGTPDEDRIDWFLTEVCPPAWNVEQDRGRSIADANAEAIARHPGMRVEIEAFYGRFQEMIPGPIQSSVDAKAALRARGMPVYGLTNFGRETFPPTAERFPFLREFDGIVVSGEEGLIKPDPAIFHLIIERFALTPARSLFIDDSAPNIASAARLGFQTHHFVDPAALPADLRARGLI